MRLALLALSFLAAGPAAAQTEFVRRPLAAGGVGNVEVVSGELLVRFATNTPRAAALAAVGALGAQDLPGVGWTLVTLPAGVPVSNALATIANGPGVLEAAPNHVYRLNRAPNDPMLGGQYGLTQINAQEGWDLEVGETNATMIAVLDTGVQADHADLDGKITLGRRACTPVCDADVEEVPACNHGTRVAGVAAAETNNATGIAGVSWGSGIHSVRIFANVPCGATTNDATIAYAVNDVVTTAGANPDKRFVINLSVGGPGVCPVVAQTAFADAVAANIPVIVAAGNDGQAVNAPANCPSAIPVAATDASGNIASFSSRGPELDARGDRGSRA